MYLTSSGSVLKRGAFDRRTIDYFVSGTKPPFIEGSLPAY